MEIQAVSTFAEYIKNYHQDCIISKCRLVLDKTMTYNGTTPDWLMSCSCCGEACIEIKYPYSINYTEANEQNLGCSYKDGDKVNLERNHQYFTQCLTQMGVTKTKTAYILCGLDYTWKVIDNITFDKELWKSMRSNFEMFYKDSY